MKRAGNFERRTRIVATIGPASGTSAMMEKLIRAGMNVARLNLSHGREREHVRYVRSIRKLNQRLNTSVAVLIDLPGPKFRIGKLREDKVVLKRRTSIVLTSETGNGDVSRIPVNLPNLARHVRRGRTILIDDGAIQLRVQSVEGEDVKCRVMVGGVLTEGRGLVVPGMKTPGPFVTDTLRGYLDFAIGQEPDFIALSFVSHPDDVREVKRVLGERGFGIPVIAKIERGDAVKRFDQILKVADGIMVARGDLGVDIPLEMVPLVQKDIIRKCNRAGKPVITATQMLESMVNSARPTRAETTDVANAIFDGTDATMLSGETSVGRYPAQAVAMMSRIALQTEKKLPYDQILYERSSWPEQVTDEMISYDACLTAYRLQAKAIVAFTESGSTARRVSRYRPRIPVLAMTPSPDVPGRLGLHWGIFPVKTGVMASVDEVFAAAVALCKRSKLAGSGDLIVITAGLPIGTVGSTNLLKVERVG